MRLAECRLVRRPALYFVAALLSGCVGDLVELTPPKPAADLAGSNNSVGDMAGASHNGDGMTAQTIHFTPDIQQDIHNLGCAAAACHAAGQTMILKDPAADTATQMANYTAFTAQANTGGNSPVLTKNLAGNAVTHSGGKAFQTVTDPVYVRWLNWINDGNLP
jgi:hypothetical protein